MNKYQEAVYRIAFTLEAKAEDYKLIQELADKATPYKLKKIDLPSRMVEVDYRKCKCGLTMSDHDSYCPDCGQALDWSE